MTTVHRPATIGGALTQLTDTPPPVAEAHPGLPTIVGDIVRIRRTMTTLTTLDTAYGSAGLDTFAVRAFTDARTQLSAMRSPDRLTANLASVVAQLGDLTAWLLHDAGHDDHAQTTLFEALAIAATTPARRTRLLVIDRLSMLAACTGDWAEALRYADRGLAYLGSTALHIEAAFRIRRGRALALAGDPQGLDEIHHATATINDQAGRHDPPWTLWLTPADLAMHHALAASDLGRHADAVDLAHQAITSLAPIRRRDAAMFGAHQLHVAINAGAWPEATTIANALITALRHTGSARAANTVHTLAATLPSAAPAATATAIEAASDAARNALL